MRKVFWIQGEKRHVMGDGRSGDHRIIRPGAYFTPHNPKISRHLAKGSRTLRIKWQRIKILLSLLELRLTNSLFVDSRRDKRTR